MTKRAAQWIGILFRAGVIGVLAWGFIHGYRSN